LGPLENKSFLDLFSGSGIIGFEALSRGSSKVEFVENNWNHLKLLESNSVYFPESNISINHADVFKYLSSSQKFDIIFADPPYGAFDLDKLFHLVISRVKPTGKYILETNRSNSKLIHNPEVRNYGKTQLAFWGQK
jgi:16S rRNA (guanine(966)-N(2))-methyltransferase RsmD